MWFERIPERREAWQYTGDIELLPDELLPVIRLTGGPCFITTRSVSAQWVIGSFVMARGRSTFVGTTSFVCRTGLRRNRIG